MDVFLLARPRLPSLRAQSVALVHAAHALAARGIPVHLPYEPAGPDPLGPYGLGPLPTLVLRPLPLARTPASLAFRALALGAVARGAILLGRELRYAAWAAGIPGARLVVEAHGVGSLQAAAAGQDPEPARQQEARALGAARALICNCEGVRRGLGWVHRLPARTVVVRNAAPAADRPIGEGEGEGEGEGVVYAGSLIPGKDLPTLAQAAPRFGGLTLLGAHPGPRLDALQRLAEGSLVPGGAVAPTALAARLRDFRAAVLPLGRGWFGAELTDPLKAWAYQAAGIPFVGADTPALRRTAPGAYLPYRPGDPDDLAAAVRRLLGDRALRDRLRARAVVRTWAQRAAEIEAVLRDV